MRNSEDRNPVGVDGRPARRPLQGVRPARLRRHDDARVRRAPARARGGLRQPQRHDRELRGRASPTAAATGSPARSPSRGPTRRPDRRGSPSATATCSRRRSTAGPDELERGEPIVAAGRFSHEAAAVDQRTGIVYETEDPGSGVGAGFYRYMPDDPEDLAAAARCEMLAIAGQPQVDLRQGQRRGAPAAGRVGPHRGARPGRHRGRRPPQHVQPGLGAGRREVQPARGLLGGRRHDLLRLHQRRRREERRRQLRRLRGGLRPGLGLPARPRHGDGGTLVLVYESPSGAECDSPDNLTVTPRGGLLACEDDASVGVRGHAPAGAGHRERQPADRHHPAAARRSSSRSTCSTAPSSPASASARAAGPLFFNLFGRARFDEDPVEGMTCAVTGPWHRGPL